MRVLLLTQYFWPETFRVNDLVAGWRERGHEVVVLTGLPNYPAGRLFAGYSFRGPWRERHAGADVIRVPLVTRGDGRLRLALNYLSFAAASLLFGAPRLDGAFDLLFVYAPSPMTVGLPALVLKARLGIPLVFWVQDLWPESLRAAGVRSRVLLSAAAGMTAIVYRGCDRLLVQSPDYVDAVVARGADARRVVPFPNWAEAFYAGAPPTASGGAGLPGGFVILFAGNLGDAQALGTILDAAELLRGRDGLQWVFVGDGARRGWLAAQIERRGLSRTVRLLASRPAERMPDLFARAGALLVTLAREPGLSRTIPSKLQSALAAGRPILAALDGAGRRVVEAAGAGFTGPAEDAGALASNAAALAALGEKERATIGRKGRSYFESHFEREALLDRLEGLLEEVVRHR